MPSLFDVYECTTFVSRFVTVTSEPGNTEWFGSVMVPVIVPAPAVCARPKIVIIGNKARTHSKSAARGTLIVRIRRSPSNCYRSDNNGLRQIKRRAQGV